MAPGPPPRWIADEMLGRLARYLRFFGHDVVYARGLFDPEIAHRAAADQRILITRDVALAAQTPGALLLRSQSISGQLQEVHAARPTASYEPTFDRCPECNERLIALASPERSAAEAVWAVWPREVPPRDGPVYACPGCRRRYWEGSHTRTIRSSVRTWLSGRAATP